MFKFSGKLTEKTIKESSKIQNFYISLVFSMFLLPFIIIAIILLVFNLEGSKEIMALCVLNVIVCVLLIFTPPKSVAFRMSKTIIFDCENDIFKVEVENSIVKPRTKRISKIRKIIDYGEWYLVIFKGDLTNNFVCQKNLLKSGTIQEFETFFTNKLKKRSK